jgi:tRNA(adenine34) deaminase
MGPVYDAARMRYELYMSHALAEAAAAASQGERCDGAVAVLDDAMVASGSDQVRATGDPTAHAVIVALREAAQRLGTPSLRGVTIYTMLEPCPMCVGALLESDADGVVYALADPVAGACGSAVQLADAEGLPRRLRVVSGIMQEEAAELLPVPPGIRRATSRGVAAR